MIQGHIKNLLYAYDCVIIPEFGGLITHYKPARIHPVKHTFSPPSKRIAFNEQLNGNDGLLISTLAKQQQWPLPQAQQAVAEFVQGLKEQLLVHHRFELQEVGVFRYNAERKLVFENIENENFLEMSFGLPDLVSKPIAGKESLVLRGNYQDQSLNSGKNSKKPVGRFQKLYRVGASLIVGGLTVTAVYMFSLQNDVALSSLNPFTLMGSPAAVQTAPEFQIPMDDAEYPVDAAASSEGFGASFAEEPVTIGEEVPTEESISASFPEISPETSPAAAAAPLVKEEVKAAAPTPVATAAKAVEPKKEVVAPAPAAAKVAEVANTTNVKQKTGRYYVIMGVFTQDGYAERNLKQLERKGYSAKIISPAHDRKRDRVSVADFATEQEAYNALPTLKKKINNELWVFNY